MKKSKALFLVLAGVFFVVMILIGYDISSRTSWPGSKPQLRERILDNKEVDSVKIQKDTLIFDTKN